LKELTTHDYRSQGDFETSFLQNATNGTFIMQIFTIMYTKSNFYSKTP